MINAPKEFKGFTVVSRMEINGEIISITTADKDGLIHWKRKGKGWTVEYEQKRTGEIVYP